MYLKATGGATLGRPDRALRLRGRAPQSLADHEAYRRDGADDTVLSSQTSLETMTGTCAVAVAHGWMTASVKAAGKPVRGSLRASNVGLLLACGVGDLSSGWLASASQTDSSRNWRKRR
jgi:hypothetical protein